MTNMIENILNDTSNRIIVAGGRRMGNTPLLVKAAILAAIKTEKQRIFIIESEIAPIMQCVIDEAKENNAKIADIKDDFILFENNSSIEIARDFEIKNLSHNDRVYIDSATFIDESILQKAIDDTSHFYYISGIPTEFNKTFYKLLINFPHYWNPCTKVDMNNLIKYYEDVTPVINEWAASYTLDQHKLFTTE